MHFSTLTFRNSNLFKFQNYIKMSLLQVPIRILTQIGARTIVHSPTAVLRKDPPPVKLSYASYEDTKSREINDKLENPPLLVMHGLFGSKGNWNSICKALQRRTNPSRKIIAVDARNHGESTHSNEHSYPACAADVKALLQAERIPHVALMGHSMGGRVCMYLALANPELVERLIVVDISPISNSQDFNINAKYFAAMASCQVPPNTALSTARASVDAALIATVPNKGIRQFLLTNLIQKPNGTVAWRINLRSLRENYANIKQFPIDMLSGAQYLGPTTFIVGGTSDHVQNKDHNAIKRLFPNATFHTIPETGHWVHSEKPDEFIEIVLDALNQPKRK